jgi:transposase
MAKDMRYRGIPTELSLEQFGQFVLPHLTVGSRGPAPRLSLHALFNHILKLLYLGCQWTELPIAKDSEGRPKIHYTRVYAAFRRWQAGGCFDIIFTPVVLRLRQINLLDVTIIHGDGMITAAKKGGDNIGFNGHKQIEGDKIVAFCDQNCNVIAPVVAAPGNHNESPLLSDALPIVTRVARSVGIALHGTVASWMGFTIAGRIGRRASTVTWYPISMPIPEAGNPPNVAGSRCSMLTYSRNASIPLSACLAGRIKFRRLLPRFERLSRLHYAFKTLAYTMINPRHFC